MAALSKRDIEMIFRAETDAAQRPVNELTSDVKRLRQGLEDLAKSSGKTDKSLDSLADTTRELEKAQSELANARTLLTQLNAQATALERAEDNAEKAAKKYQDLKTQVDGAEKPTKRLTTSMEAAERKMNATNQRLDEQRAAYKEVKSSIESIIGPVDNLQDAFRTVAVAQRDITQGLAQAKGAVSEFKSEIASANAEAAKLKSLEDFKADARASGVPEDRINAIAEEANRTQLLAQAKRDLAAQDAKYRAAAEAAAATSSVQLVEAIERTRKASAEAAAAQDRLEQVGAFRKLAADSIAAESATDRIKASLDGGTTSAQRLADAIFNIVNPAQASASTLAGMDERLDAVIKKLSGGRISVNEWSHLNNELQAVQAGLIRASAEVDNFTKQQSRVDEAAAAFDRQAAKVREFASAEIHAGDSIEQMTADLQREERQLEALGVQLDRETAKLREFSNSLGRVGIDSNNLPAAIGRIEATATRAAPAIKKVADTVSPTGKKGFLGLDPYQLQNLSYQVNDVFTSLASGAPPMQVFAQQAGQILQIFPGIFSSIARLLPVLAPLAAGFVVVAGAIAEANTQIEQTRSINTTLASLGELNGYDPKKFKDIIEDFRALGVSAEEAAESAKIFVTEGLNPAAVDDYVVAAKNLATVQGIDVKTATEELTKAFTAGADEVLALDDKYHFLTDTQRDNIAASKDTKTEHDEVRKAFTQLYNKMQEGANAAKGPFTDATNTLRTAWRGLLDTFADTGVIQAATNFITNAVRGFTYLINLAKRVAVVFKGSGEAYNQGAKFGGPAVGAIFAGAKVGANIGSGGYENPLTGALNDTLQQMQASSRNLTQKQTAPGVDAGAGSRARQRGDEADAAKARKKAEQDRKKAAKDAEAEAKRRQREAEQLERQYQNEQDQLQASLSRFTVEAIKGTQAPLSQQLELARQAVDEQFKAVEDRLAEFREKFGGARSINGMSQEQYAAALNAQKQQIMLARQLGVYESNVNDVMRSRQERLKAIQEDQAAGLITSQEALDRTQQVVDEMGPQINAAITAARAFIAALTPSAETQALLDKFDRITKQNGNGYNTSTTVRKQADAGVSKNEKDINDLFQRRADLIDAANNLYEAGAINYTQREAQIKAAYENTNKEILKGITQARTYLELNRNLLSPGVYNNAIAALDVYNSKLKYSSELTVAVKQSAQQAVAQGFTNMFDALAQGLANVITGAGSLKDILGGLGKAALNFAAQFTKAIADAIIQIYALRIAKSLIGGFHGGGVVGDYGSGQMKLSRNIGLGALNLSNVPRYHEGTSGAGLKSNEMLAVLEKGEKVQTEDQQRLEANRLKNARSGGGTSLRQVLAFGDEQVAAAMQGQAGEATVVTHLRRNVPLIKQLLGE